MLSDFMITLCIRAHAPLALVAIALFASGCQKVPLLAPSGSTITLSSAATALPANGTTTIVAQVIEPSGTPPHAGTLVSFTTTLGTIQPSEVETDISGRATTTFNANGASGTATITAISGGVSAGTTGAVKIAVGAAAVSSIILSASPISLPSSGGASTISATVYDSGGNGVGGVPVTFTAAAGSVSPSVANTDTAGVARTVLTTSRTAEVTAAAGVSATSGTTTTAAPTAKITVAVNLTATITVGTPTPAIPSVGQTVSFPLTYGTTTGSSPITRVTMSWGDGASQTFTGQPAVVSHSYGAVGSYLVTFTGTDAAGDPSTTSTNINVFSESYRESRRANELTQATAAWA